MKKLTYQLSLLLVTIGFSSVYAQVNVKDLRKQKQEGIPAQALYSKSTEGVAANTAMFLQNLFTAQSKSSGPLDSAFMYRYSIIKLNSSYYVNAFLQLRENVKIEALAAEGVLFQGNTSNKILSALLPLNKVEEISVNSSIKYLGISERAHPTMDNARTSTWVHWLHQGLQLNQSYYGAGVIVGIIDVGFDYTHPNFYDGSGANNYRIKRVWEQSSVLGLPPIGFSYGRELVGKTAILNAQSDNINVSHGTHVAGIAAGAGGGVNTTHVGVAPQADLVLVSTNLSNAGISQGIEYILNHASSVGKPCVINISIGGHYGPHDGTSSFDQFCNNAVGPGKLLVGSAGNAGGRKIFLGKTYTNTDTIMYTLFKNDNTFQKTDAVGSVNIWGNANKNFYISVNIYNSNTNSFEDWTPYLPANVTSSNTYVLEDNDAFPDDCLVTITTGISPLNNKAEVLVQIDHSDQDDSYRWAMIEIIANNTQTKMWSFANNTANSFTNDGNASPFYDGSTNSTVSEIGGTGPAIISVGAYTSKNSWTSFSGSSQNAPFFGPNGAIAPFSSKGPTADGRTKPDITAPGNVIVSSTNSFDMNYQSSSNSVVTGVSNGTDDWWFGTMQGTSMSSPIVAGIMALWLEAYPALSPQHAKNILKSSAFKDSHTGTIGANGNNIWGWGKIDAHNGMLDLLQSIVGITEMSNLEIALFPNPASDKVLLSFSESQQLLSIHISDLAGRVVYSQEYRQEVSGIIEIPVEKLRTGTYYIQANTERGVGVQKLMIYK